MEWCESREQDWSWSRGFGPADGKRLRRGSDVPAPFADLSLEIADDPLEIGFVEARLEQFIPQPFPIKTQAHALARQAAIQRVSLLDPFPHGLWRVRPASPGTCSMACCMV
jgi:hypothetical protein